MVNKGKDYEQFVKRLQQALLDSEDLIKQNNVAIEANKKIIDNCGVEREFDLYWEYELAGVTYKTVVECKDYQSTISIEKIDALIGKTRDIPDLKALFATKIGYQSGAEQKAEFNKIDLLIVREQTEEDWQDFIKGIDINLELLSPAITIKFIPEIDGNWTKENTDLDLNKSISLNSQNNLIFIEDNEKSDKYTILQLEERLGTYHRDRGESGKYTREEEFNDAYIYWDDHKLKLRKYTIHYSVSPPMKMPISINYTKELIGVIEYIRKNTKTAVYKDKIIKDWR